MEERQRRHAARARKAEARRRRQDEERRQRQAVKEEEREQERLQRLNEKKYVLHRRVMPLCLCMLVLGLYSVAFHMLVC